MKPFAAPTWILTAACLASSAVAQASDPTAGAPPPRVPRTPVAVSVAPVSVAPASAATSFAAPVVAADASASDLGVRFGSPQPERRDVGTLPMSHDRYSRVYWDTDEQGTIWVRGRNYKASFGVDGATFYPLLGSDQPRHFPLELSLASATSGGTPIPLAPIRGAVRDGDRVIVDRGAIDEVYEIGVESLEQTFVVEERTQGDLQLVVRLETELGRTEDADGFEFSNDLGGVRYSRAFLRAASGAKLPLSTRASGSDLQIDVAAADVAASSFPLVIDPVLRTFDVDGTSFDNFDPDVAYDATTDRYMYVYMERVTATDRDVFSELVNGGGTILAGDYVNLFTDLMREVSVANLNAYDQFLVAMTDSTRIVGRVTGAGAIAYSPTFEIYSGASPSELSVGGDPYGAAPAYFCVVWQRNTLTPFLATDVLARLVTNTGLLVGTPLPVATTSLSEFEPEVSRGNNGIRWNVVWSRGAALTHVNEDPYADAIYGAQIEWDGSGITTPAFPINASIVTRFPRPSVSSPVASGEYLVAWQDQGPPGALDDIFAARIIGASVSTTMSITGLENAANQTDDQRFPQVELADDRFVVAYLESRLNVTSKLRVASFALLPGEVRCLEAHVLLSAPNFSVYGNTIACTAASGGPPRIFALGWYEPGVPSYQQDIRGAFFEAHTVSTYCYGDGTGALCPCGNSGGAGRGCANSVSPTGAQLSTLGDSDTSADDLQLRGVGMPLSTTCLFFQGTTTGPNAGLGATFGDGLRCTGGSTVRLAAKTTSFGVAFYPQAGDPSISVRGLIPAGGGERTYQVWYRNSATFCTAATFNLTNGVRVVWLP